MNCTGGGHEETETNFPVQHSEEEWRQKLSPAQFAVLRKHGTEPPAPAR